MSKARPRDVEEFVVNLQSTLSVLRRKQGEEAMTATAHAEGDGDRGGAEQLVGLALSPYLNARRSPATPTARRSPSTATSPSHPGRHGQLSGSGGEVMEGSPESAGRNGMSAEEVKIELETEKLLRRQVCAADGEP